MSKTPEEMAEEYSFDYMLLDDPKYAMSITKKAFLAGYQAAQQWISVKDRNPPAKTMVLVCHKNFGIQMGYLDENSVKPCRNHWVVYVREHEEWTGNNIPKTGKYEYVNISHWMELPAPPKEEK